MNEDVANSSLVGARWSRTGIKVAVLFATILATLFVTGGDHPNTLMWQRLLAIASIVLALVLLAVSRRESAPSAATAAMIHSYVLAILAIAFFLVGARWGFPIASFADAPNNQMHRILRAMVTLLCSISILIALCLGVFSRTAWRSPMFWLAFSLNLLLI